MKNHLFSIIGITTLLYFGLACNQSTCKSSNSIFNTYSPETKIYKDTLVDELKKMNHNHLRYWLDSFYHINGLPHLFVSVQGNGICAKMEIIVPSKAKGAESIIKNKGQGYAGAELIGLDFEIKQDSTNTVFILQKINRIID